MAAGKNDQKTGKNQITVEGHGLKLCMNTDGVVGMGARSNSTMEMKEVLAIKAER